MEGAGARYRLVVMGASLGGVEALSVVLGGLSPTLPVPIVIAQHIGPTVSRLDRVLERFSRLPVSWAEDGMQVKPGRVFLCPARSFARIEPDGTLTVTGGGRTSSHGQIDGLLESAARSHGQEVLAFVLTGMGNDGVVGARAVRAAGGTVIVQDELTSLGFKMPEAVIDGGAADLVVSLSEIPELINDVVGRGQRLPLPEVLATEAVFAAGGEMGRLMSATEWSRSPLGPVERWPATLRTVLAAILSSQMPMCVMWGAVGAAALQRRLPPGAGREASGGAGATGARDLG